MRTHDTIVAISSATGFAPRMIIRLCGPDACDIASKLDIELATDPPSHPERSRRISSRPGTSGSANTKRSFDYAQDDTAGTSCFAKLPTGAHDVRLTVDDLRFAASALVFHAPRSATGEDTVELHIPGNPHLARRVVDACLAAGARSADPGEFTARALFKGKLTLDAAEGVGAAVGATNEAELRAARRLIAGALGERLRPVLDLLTQTLALTEVGIDFTEEDVTFQEHTEAAERVRSAERLLRDLLAETPRLERLSRTPTIVFVGRPNVGKSTLVNALLGTDRVVTSDIAGTTRDVIGAELALPAGIVEVRDVAGLDGTDGVIETQMREQALRAVETADVLVLLRAGKDEPTLPREPDLVVDTKHDLRGVGVSAVTGHGLPELRQQLSDLAFGTERPGLALTARHHHEITAAADVLVDAVAHVDTEELFAADVRVALDHLGTVLGKVTPDDILGEVFGKFCVGK